MKTLQVIYGPQDDRQMTTVQLHGESEEAILRPKMAKRAARIACGHVRGVTVMDKYFGYHIYSEKRNSHRKVFPDNGEQKNDD